MSGHKSAASRRAAEQEAHSLSIDPFGEAADVVVPGGASLDSLIGQSVDVVLETLKKNNPSFSFKVNHMWEQYPLVMSTKFVRILKDDTDCVSGFSRQ